MKKIEAIIKSSKLSDVRDALNAIGVQGMTISHVEGFGRQKGHTEIYRSSEVSINFVPKIKIDIVVSDDQANKIVDAIVEKAKTGNIGDGKIFISDVSQVVRIRTGEKGKDAL